MDIEHFRIEDFYNDLDFMVALFYNDLSNKNRWYYYDNDSNNECKIIYYEKEEENSDKQNRIYCNTDLLNNLDIYEIAKNFNKNNSDDILVSIITNETDNDNNKKLFKEYLDNKKIKFLYPKKTLVAKVFYYILHNKIDIIKGIRFVHYYVSNNENITEYVGDDVGIEEIIGDFYAIYDGDITNEKDIETTKKLIFENMQRYVHDNMEKINTR